MPKKYKQKSLLTKPTSSAPSNLSLSNAAVSHNVPPTKTVNDLIRESRQGTSNDRPQAVSTGTSIPPSLRAVLDMPTPPPPAPRLGIRGPTRLRRIPGPPPPRSWLAESASLLNSVHAPAEYRDIPWSKAHERTRVQKQSSILPEGNYPAEKSFRQVVMKAMASNWQWHADYDHEYLAELPVKIKQTLLSYIAIYSDGQGPDPLRLLFPGDLSLEERDEVRRLDLGNAIGSWTTLKKLEKELEGDRTEALRSGPSDDQEVPEVWDETEVTEPSEIGSSLWVGSMRFRNLKHLSLAVVPGTSGSIASWSGLLAIAAKLSTLTSLSLAYWPQPTYTPNASARMSKVRTLNVGSAPAVTYGGTNFYSAFDNDWREAAGILRTLSKHLYCLNWLDLTGCGDWFSALAWHQSVDNEPLFGTTGPEWNRSWRGVEYLILAVGWSPGPVHQADREVSSQPVSKAVEASSDHQTAGEHMSSILARLSATRLGTTEAATDDSDIHTWNVEVEREKYYHRMEVTRYNEIQTKAREVAQALRTIRKGYGGKWINVDYGPRDDF